jgi:hypothetical protein
MSTTGVSATEDGKSSLNGAEPRVFSRFSAPLVVECFCASNLVFLGADIFVAHSSNSFARQSEWVPVYFGLLGGLALVPGLFAFRSRRANTTGLVIGGAAVVVGVVGTLLHLSSTFFVKQSLHHLVYTAPFAAPLSFVGVGLLLWLNRMETGESWARWVLFLTGGSFVGLFALTLADHAQNGFFHSSEWVGVVSAAYGAVFTFGAALTRAHRPYLTATSWLLLLQVVVGIAGFVLHLGADIQSDAPTWWDRFVFGAPVFAPLLFPNMALLGWIGCLALSDSTRTRALAEPVARGT